MGHTVDEWIVKVAGVIRDQEAEDVGAVDIETVGLHPAFAQFSTDRPMEVYAEVAGSGGAYFALPGRWVRGFSAVTAVEFPARQNPPQFLDDQSWRVIGSVADPAVQQILLLSALPGPGQYVRFTYTAPWPYPTDDRTVDQVGDLAFEAVAALAASFCCVSLSGQAARSRVPAMANDVITESSRAASLLEAAKMYRSVYDSYLGLGGLTESGGDDAPAYGRLDFDPSYYALFHGGRR